MYFNNNDIEEKIYKTKNSYYYKNKDGKIISKLNYYDYNIPDFDWILVANLDTRKEYRRRRLATNLLNSLYKDIDKQGKGLYMAVSINNYNALKLYKELGFKENKKYKSDGNEYIIMIKGNADTNQFKNMNFS